MGRRVSFTAATCLRSCSREGFALRVLHVSPLPRDEHGFVDAAAQRFVVLELLLVQHSVGERKALPAELVRAGAPLLAVAEVPHASRALARAAQLALAVECSSPALQRKARGVVERGKALPVQVAQRVVLVELRRKARGSAERRKSLPALPVVAVAKQQKAHAAVGRVKAPPVQVAPRAVLVALQPKALAIVGNGRKLLALWKLFVQVVRFVVMQKARGFAVHKRVPLALVSVLVVLLVRLPKFPSPLPSFAPLPARPSVHEARPALPPARRFRCPCACPTCACAARHMPQESELAAPRK